MHKEYLSINGIRAIIWGNKSDKVYLFVHGKMSNMEAAKLLADSATQKGYQVLSFDLPEHGLRKQEGRELSLANAMEDLSAIGIYAKERWTELSLFACSLGAHFSLMTYGDYDFKNCLFQSPIVDMEALVRNMFVWYGLSEELLREKGYLETPSDPISLKWFDYVLSHPVKEWKTKTHILYASRDMLQSIQVVNGFAKKHLCDLTVADGRDHPFMEDGDEEFVREWIESHV